ncbi:MAG: IS21 family transposase [Bacteroidia bacterium]|nr:IS21 family transposase [Bacteroidia bacterium]
MLQEHKAGDKLFVDFAGKKLSVVDPQTGEMRDMEVFVAVLGASQLMYVEAVESQQKGDFLLALANALDYFGGVPAAIVPDNLKSAVTKTDKYEPELNPDLAAFGRHYGTSILPARPYKPKDKSLAEGGVKLAYRRIYAPLRNQSFTSLRELNQAIRSHLEGHNQKPFQHRDYSRRDLFLQIEKDQLSPLPAHRWEPKTHTKATVYQNSHVWLGADKHYYSVPFAHIGKKVDVFFSAKHVEIHLNHSRIAFHLRERKAYGYSTQAHHMPSSHNFRAEWHPERFIRWAATIGPHTRELITRILNGKAHPEQAFKSCLGLLNMSKDKKIGQKRLEKAAQRAIDFNQYSYRFVKNTLHHHMEDTQPEAPNESQYRLPFHDNIRGKDYYN